MKTPSLWIMTVSYLDGVNLTWFESREKAAAAFGCHVLDLELEIKRNAQESKIFESLQELCIYSQKCERSTRPYKKKIVELIEREFN